MNKNLKSVAILKLNENIENDNLSHAGFRKMKNVSVKRKKMIESYQFNVSNDSEIRKLKNT